MSETSRFLLTIRTPHEVTMQAEVCSLRVPTESGQVGLRACVEATVIAVEPGVVHAHRVAGKSANEIFVGTAGGLLMCDGNTATLLTPLAVTGEDQQHIEDQITEQMERPNSELEARATLSKLEGHILSELRREQRQGVSQRLEQPF
jgi:F0F1-type ATP synthase epsilon subunit